jgi:hypothetical protein
MATRLKFGGIEKQQRLNSTLDVLHNQAADLANLNRKIAASKTTWLVAGLVDGLNRHYKAPPIPEEFIVLATDGSHIDIDRHQSIRCYLINIGSAILNYGTHRSAILDSYPHLYFTDEDLVITPTGIGGREQLIEGALLGIKRSVDECRQLVELAKGMLPGIPSLALLDGSLILWGLEAYPEFITEALLHNGFLGYLDQIRQLNNKQSALASYISFPRSTDVVNTLRVALCHLDPVDCDRCCPTSEIRDCDVVTGIRDRDLFLNLLGPGERSSLFISPSKVVEKHYGANQVYFFYLRNKDEVARIEIPRWVAIEEDLLTLVHTLVLDQCQRGYGYPVALSEAHEKAVITTADRENFWHLVESSLVKEHMSSLGSAKSRSKRTRWV